MKIPQIALIIVLNFFIAFVTAKYVVSNNGATTVAHESAYDRVMHTGILRCGYGIWEPALSKDPNTGQLSGIFYDYLEALGRATALKIEWVAEVGWGDFPAALNDGKIDAMCAGMWPKAVEAKTVLFTMPTYFLPINAYVKADDTRFDHAIDQANSASIKISVMDSELSSELAKSRFPLAQTTSITQLSDPSMLLINVANGKADITFTDAWTGAAFMASNPGKLKVVPLDIPLRLYGHTIAIAQGEYALQNLLNVSTQELLTSGELEAIVRKHEKFSGVLQMQKTQYQ